MTKPTIYTAFANSTDPASALPNLSDEAFKIADLMQGLAFTDKLYYLKDELFDPQRLIHNFSRYGERFTLFYFSGHGKDGCITMTGDHTVSPEQMSRVINSNLGNLQFAFFNACETLDLARAIVEERLKKGNKKDLVLISSPREVNSFVAERFATLVFTQIGQPGTYYDAYQQAKDLIRFTNHNISFYEIGSTAELYADHSQHDFCYLELRKGRLVDHTMDTPGQQVAKTKKTSIIGNDKTVSDVLRANYLKEVVHTLSDGTNLTEEVAVLLQQALEASREVVAGTRKPKEVQPTLASAAAATPGLPSEAPFRGLINKELKKDDPFVSSFAPARDASINQLQSKLDEYHLVGGYNLG